MKKHIPWCAALLLGLLACNLAQPGTTAAPPVLTPIAATQTAAGTVGVTATVGTATAQPQTSPVPAVPISLGVTLDAAHAISAVVPITGGVLTATGADGSIFSLEIPADALLQATEITMTPLKTLAGMPFGSGPALAVSLAPDGLFLYNFVTLTITPAQAISIKEQILFGYAGPEHNLALALPVLASRDIKIQLLHFSGYGVTKGLLADIEPWRRRLGGSDETRIRNEISALVQAERQRQLLGGEPTADLTGFQSLMQEFENRVVKPRLAAAGESCAAGRLAIETLVGIERQRQLIGLSQGNSSQDSETAQLVEMVGKVCLKEEYELCRDNHIIHRIIGVWLGIARQFDLTGNVSSTLSQEAEKLVRQCLRFELELDSTATMTGRGIQGESRMTAKVPIQIDALTTEAKLTGKSALDNESFNVTFKCVTASNRGGSTLNVYDLTWTVETESADDKLGHITDMKLTFFPQKTSETFTTQCPGQPPITVPMPVWFLVFGGVHADEWRAEGFVFEAWEMVGNELFAQREWDKQAAVSGATQQESGTFKLYHRPGP